MSKHSKEPAADEMLPEYDFSKGTRGKYVKQFEEGSNIVALAPDLVQSFPTSEAVNDALRSLVEQRHRMP